MRIANIGTRGIPATFGGIEHHVEEVGSRLAERGHEVTVYCRSNYVSAELRYYKGMRLVRLPTVSSKRLAAAKRDRHPLRAPRRRLRALRGPPGPREGSRPPVAGLPARAR